VGVLVWLVIALWTLVPGCELPPDDDGEDDAVTVLFAVEPGGPAPFPFDLFTVEDATTGTGLRVDLGELNTPFIDLGLDPGFTDAATLRAMMDDLDGFGTFAPIVVGLSGEIDATTLPRTPDASVATGSAVFLVDIQSGSDRAGERVPVEVRAEVFTSGGAPLHALVVVPVVPLLPANRYGLVVTRAVTDAQGLPLGRSADFEAAVGLAPAPADHAAPDRLERAVAVLAPLLEHLGGTEPPPALEDLAGATVFTTQSATQPLLAIRDFLEGDDPPLAVDLDLDDDGTPDVFTVGTLPDPPGHLPDMTGVGPILRGTFDAPDLRGESGDVVFDESGAPAVSVVRSIPFVLILPADPAAQPCPLVVLQHGHGARKEDALYVAGHLARAGLATIAIDHVGHGELAGLGDFINVTDVEAIRGTFVQTIVNQLRLFRAIPHLDSVDVVPSGAPDGVPDLDVEGPVGFIGESLGGITGQVATSLEPSVEVVVLNVTCGGIRYLMGAFIGLLVPDELALLETQVVVQTIMDRVDPINFARPIDGSPGPGGAPAVLMQGIVADHLVPVAGTEALARALELPLVCPCPDGHGVTGLEVVDAPAESRGLAFFDSGARHGDLLSGVHSPEASEAMRAQAARFIESYGASGMAIIDFE
jgi:nucleotide-binding universal stress UspA family protein